MNQDEFEKIEQLKLHRPAAMGADLKSQVDRTLIYGYNIQRQTFHVYLKAGVIHKVTYLETSQSATLLEHKIESEISSDESYAPDKRAYPERCDFEFCSLLTSHGAQISFTNFEGDRARAGGAYFGLTLEDLEDSQQ